MNLVEKLEALDKSQIRRAFIMIEAEKHTLATQKAIIEDMFELSKKKDHPAIELKGGGKIGLLDGGWVNCFDMEKIVKKHISGDVNE